jgi:hypothetical protein
LSLARVVSRRQILVTSANWIHNRMTEDEPVIDASDNGHSSVVRVCWPSSAQMGVTDYLVHGFIRPDHPAEYDRLIEATPAAIRTAKDATGSTLHRALRNQPAADSPVKREMPFRPGHPPLLCR